MKNRQRYFHHLCQVFSRKAATPVRLAALALVVLSPYGNVFAQSEEEPKGVFVGDYVGCTSKSDLFAYYEAKQEENRTVMGTLIGQRKCRTLAGRSYVPLLTGFVTARVRVTFQDEEITLWTRSLAVVESPPPPRGSYFNF